MLTSMSIGHFSISDESIGMCLIFLRLIVQEEYIYKDSATNLLTHEQRLAKYIIRIIELISSKCFIKMYFEILKSLPYVQQPCLD